MTLPTNEKTWTFDVNNAGGVSSGGFLIDHQLTLYAIKTAMVALGWTVVASSDSTAPGTGLGDNWSASDKLIWNNPGSAHSWMVFQQAGIDANFQVCLDCASNAAYYLTVGISPGGYNNDGTNTNRPTAADEYVVMSAAAWGVPSASFNSKVHVMVSDDGECTRILVCTNNGTTGLMFFDKPKNPVTGWATPWVSVAQGTINVGQEQATYNNFSDNAKVQGDPGGGLCSMYLTSEGYLAASGGEYLVFPDDQTGEWPMFPAGLICTTVGNRGRKGAMFDLWWGSTFQSTGDTYPAAGTYLYAQFGDLILPWDGSLPQVT